MSDRHPFGLCMLLFVLLLASGRGQPQDLVNFTALPSRVLREDAQFDLKDSQGVFWRVAVWVNETGDTKTSSLMVARMVQLEEGKMCWSGVALFAFEGKVDRKAFLVQDRDGVYHIVFALASPKDCGPTWESYAFWHISSLDGENWSEPERILEASGAPWSYIDLRPLEIGTGQKVDREGIVMYTLASDVEGKLWLVWKKWQWCEWGDCIDTYVSVSDTQQTNWTEPLTANDFFGVTIHDVCGFFSDENGTLWCYYRDSRIWKAYGTYHHFIFSDDGGRTWSEPQSLVPHFWDTPKPLSYFQLLKDTEGNLWYFWQAYESTPYEALLKQFILDLSQDSGVTWTSVGYSDWGTILEDLGGLIITFQSPSGGMEYVRVTGNEPPLPIHELPGWISLLGASVLVSSTIAHLGRQIPRSG